MGTNFGPGGIKVIVTRCPHTPVIVSLRGATATFDCANQTGDVEGNELTRQQSDYLASIEGQAEDYYNTFRDVNA
jgi:hypothetical protein